MTDKELAAELLGVSKSYQRRQVVKGIDLAVEDGAFFSILGPSGCGKTTTLRLLGGFVRPDGGEIRLAGRSVNDVPPHRRNVNTVFQSYALFGHLTVHGNVAFGLKRKKMRSSELRERVARMLRIVSLEDRAEARPSELSGGQQQRVALARALVNMPELLLLDEPLGALDLKLRRQMQVELKQIQREVGVAFVYVTHDQEEALTMSDRIAVMNDGVIHQVGSPTEVYDHPVNRFVAEFIGSINSMPGTVRHHEVRLDAGVHVPAPRSNVADGTAVVACVRPEKMLIAAAEAAPDAEQPGSSMVGTIHESVYLGSGVSYRVRTDGGADLQSLVPRGAGHTEALAVGQRVALRWLPEDCHYFRASDGQQLASSEPASTAIYPTTSSPEKEVERT